MSLFESSQNYNVFVNNKKKKSPTSFRPRVFKQFKIYHFLLIKWEKLECMGCRAGASKCVDSYLINVLCSERRLILLDGPVKYFYIFCTYPQTICAFYVRDRDFV